MAIPYLPCNNIGKNILDRIVLVLISISRFLLVKISAIFRAENYTGTYFVAEICTCTMENELKIIPLSMEYDLKKVPENLTICIIIYRIINL